MHGPGAACPGGYVDCLWGLSEGARKRWKGRNGVGNGVGTRSGNCSGELFRLFKSSVPRFLLQERAGPERGQEQSMSFSRAKRRPYNARKQVILTALEAVYPESLRADAIAWKAKVSPKRGVYDTLKRLHRWGLIQRRLGSDGLLYFRLSSRGRGRLAWFRSIR